MANGVINFEANRRRFLILVTLFVFLLILNLSVNHYWNRQGFRIKKGNLLDGQHFVTENPEQTTTDEAQGILLDGQHFVTENPEQTATDEAQVPIFTNDSRDWLAVMKGRKEHLQQVCNKYNLQQFTPLQLAEQSKRYLRFIIVNDYYKTLYCFIPKAGCTNWKKVFWILKTGERRNLSTIDSDDIHKYYLRLLPEKSTKEIINRLNTYTKFLVVREPMERLVSAFRNKFEGTGKSSVVFRKFMFPTIFKSTGYLNKFTFTEFVRYLLLNGINRTFWDRHWDFYNDLCHPCEIGYDFIGKYETMDEDSERILRFIKAPDFLHYPAFQETKTKSLLNEYLGQLSPESKTNLIKLYQKDFELFGYNYSLYL